jgi:hypothetical protein
MLLVFLAGVLPKEYLHDLLYQHHDTEHPVLKKGEFVLSKKHTHCSFLGFAFGPYISSPLQFFSLTEQAVYTSYELPLYSFRYATAHHALLLRGPPGDA